MPEILSFEDFAAGQKFALGEHLMDEAEMIAFAREYDPQPQHIDPIAAEQDMFGGLIGSGWNLGGIAMRLIVDGLFNRSTCMGSPGMDELQWRRPTRAGDRLQLHGEVLETRPSASKRDRGFVKFRFDMMRGDERVMFFVCTVIFGTRATV